VTDNYDTSYQEEIKPEDINHGTIPGIGLMAGRLRNKLEPTAARAGHKGTGQASAERNGSA